MRYDCPSCGSAKSIEYGLCQVCLMEFPVETKVITLPPARLSLEPERERVVAPEAAGAD